MRTLKSFVALAAVLSAFSLIATAADKAAPAAKVTGEIVARATSDGRQGRGPHRAPVHAPRPGIRSHSSRTAPATRLPRREQGRDERQRPNHPLVAKKVTLTGKWYEKGGAKIFAIDKIEAVAPAAAAK
jgi:hypothetical protein